MMSGWSYLMVSLDRRPNKQMDRIIFSIPFTLFHLYIIFCLVALFFLFRGLQWLLRKRFKKLILFIVLQVIIVHKEEVSGS